jgi:hypothetical protein
MYYLNVINEFDTICYVVIFSQSNHNVILFVELTIIGQGQKFNY